jgi:hypothetical protein
VMRDFAEIWRAAEKTVYSRTPQATSSARTQVLSDAGNRRGQPFDGRSIEAVDAAGEQPPRKRATSERNQAVAFECTCGVR